MAEPLDTALLEGRGGRSRPMIPPEIAADPLMQAKLWNNPCWFSFRVNYLALHFNNPIYGFLQQRLGLLRPDTVVLWALQVGGVSAFGDVVRAAGFPKNTLSRAAQKLEGLGLIAREIDAADQRRVTLRLTEAGKAVVAIAAEAMITHERKMLDCLSPAERMTLSDILTKMIAASGDWPQAVDLPGPEPDEDRRQGGDQIRHSKREKP